MRIHHGKTSSIFKVRVNLHLGNFYIPYGIGSWRKICARLCVFLAVLRASRRRALFLRLNVFFLQYLILMFLHQYFLHMDNESKIRLLVLPSCLCYIVGLCLCYRFSFPPCLIPEGVIFNSVQFCTVLLFWGGEMILNYNGRD